MVVLLWGLTACSSESGLGPGAGGDAGSPGTLPGPRDECGNGIDDDGDGRIDDGCPCAPGETQRCFSGEVAERGTGLCSDGLQTCATTGSVEFGDWGDSGCLGDTRPAEELCDELDNDCDGTRDEDCPCAIGDARECGVEFLLEPCNGGTQSCRLDGTWSGCEGAVLPEPDVCGDGIDNDCDGEQDEACGCEPTAELCRNDVDDDCDGDIDEIACSPDWPLDTEEATPPPPNCDDLTTGEPDRVVQVTAGWQYSCALLASGAVKCWGQNNAGQLGDGTTMDRHTPVSVIDLDDAVAIAAGWFNPVGACALRCTGEVVCWGRSETSHVAPPLSRPILDGVALSQNAVLRRDGTVAALTKDWPGNGFRGLDSSASLPIDVDVTDVVQISSHALRTSTGQTMVWAYGFLDTDGDGVLTNHTRPTPVLGLDGSLSVSHRAGASHGCALRPDHTLLCWGHNLYGEVGTGTTTVSEIRPVPVVGLGDVAEVEVGTNSTCARRMDGAVLCWGLNRDGSLLGQPVSGDGTIAVPTVVEGLNDIAELGDFVHRHACAIRESGEVVCWGWNERGALGNGATGTLGAIATVMGLP